MADDRDPEQRAAVPRPEADEWPLLCVEKIDVVAGATYYRVLAEGENPDPGTTVRRCRRVPPSKVIRVQALISDATDAASDVGEWVYSDTFANWEDVSAKARPGAEEALKRWADEWLDVDAFELGPEVERG